MRYVSVRLEAELYGQLSAVAEGQDRPKSRVLADMVRAYCESSGGKVHARLHEPKRPGSSPGPATISGEAADREAAEDTERTGGSAAPCDVVSSPEDRGPAGSDHAHPVASGCPHPPEVRSLRPYGGLCGECGALL